MPGLWRGSARQGESVSRVRLRREDRLVCEHGLRRHRHRGSCRIRLRGLETAGTRQTLTAHWTAMVLVGECVCPPGVGSVAAGWPALSVLGWQPGVAGNKRGTSQFPGQAILESQW